VILLATGWGTAVAAQITSVLVTNDAAHPVPVQEQRADAQGNVRVHEQGTADVNVTNASLPVHEQGTVSASPTPAANFPVQGIVQVDGGSVSDYQFLPAINVSSITIGGAEENMTFALRSGSSLRLYLGGAGYFTGGSSTWTLTFPQPIPADTLRVQCFESAVACKATVSVAGRP
jgi:hypothetical protein